MKSFVPSLLFITLVYLGLSESKNLGKTLTRSYDSLPNQLHVNDIPNAALKSFLIQRFDELDMPYTFSKEILKNIYGTQVNDSVKFFFVNEPSLFTTEDLEVMSYLQNSNGLSSSSTSDFSIKRVNNQIVSQDVGTLTVYPSNLKHNEKFIVRFEPKDILPEDLRLKIQGIIMGFFPVNIDTNCFTGQTTCDSSAFESILSVGAGMAWVVVGGDFYFTATVSSEGRVLISKEFKLHIDGIFN